MKKYIVTVNGKKFEVEVEEAVGGASVPTAPAPTHTPQPVQSAPAAPAPAPTPAPAAGQNPVKAPMPGTILDVKVSQGQQIKKGQVMFILEAMKMENEIMAGQDGTVVSVNVSKGSAVNTDDTLAVVG